ncbi:alpha/beta fold hydrolase [Micromonospora sp. RB23]
MSRRSTAVTSLALVVTVGLVGYLAAMPADATDVKGAAAKGVTWGACPAPVAAVAPTLQCGTVSVPLSYSDPDGQQIELAVSRIPSTNPAKRRGVLLMNPGGPGVPGLTMPNDLVTLGAPSGLTDAYDLIGTDPRGTGKSAPVDCKFTLEQKYSGNIPPYAVDAAAVEEQAAKSRAVAEQCAANDTGGLMAHISTANAARDLDRIRLALGERKASFFGLSYGSALGMAYASMFPYTSDRVIIDSNTGDTALTRASLRRFARGAEQAFPDFAAWVAQRHQAYGLGRTPAQVRANYFRTAQRLDKTPVATVDGQLFRAMIYAGLYNRPGDYARTARFWQLAAASNPAAARELTAAAGPGTAGATPQPGSVVLSAYLVTVCNDSVWPRDIQAYQRSVAEDRKAFALYGAATANINPCAFWPFKPSEPQVAVNDNGPANVLIMQNRRDTATPLLGGQLARKAFAKRSRLVTVDENQHGVFIFDDNPCALNAGTAWLVDGVMPKRDIFCKASAG